jgi:predicted DNA-binding antitoxin AbrB/MazE fold protein
MMTITILAIYRDGVLQPERKLELPENTPVQLQVTPLFEATVAGSAQAILPYEGTWLFEPGELDQLLTDIEQMRLLDLGSDA